MTRGNRIILPRGRHLSRRLGLAGLLAAALLAGCSEPETGRGNLEGAKIGGPFQLVDESGAAVTEASYQGRWRLMYFGYTFCPDVCPVDTAKLAQGFAAFEKAHPDRAARVQPLFVTVDPERDTPAALAEFTDQFHPRLIGLTGTRPQIDAALKTFRIYAKKAEGATEGSYLVDHAALYYLFDPDGVPVAFLAPLTAGPAELVAMLEQHVR